MGPEASPANYKQMGVAGYSDQVAECAPGETDELITWDPRNPLNSCGPHKASPPQRCDHLFIHKDAGIMATSVRRVFTSTNVPTSTENSTMSDHYGLLATLRRK